MSNKGRYVRKLTYRKYLVELRYDKKFYVEDITNEPTFDVPSYLGKRDDHIFRLVLESVDEKRALNSARWRYCQARKLDSSLPPLNSSPNKLINRDSSLATPDQKLLTSRSRALEEGLKYYVGKSCQKHPDNNIRYTSSSGCVICSSAKFKESQKLR